MNEREDVADTIIKRIVMDPLKTLTNDLVVFMDSQSSIWRHIV